MPSKYRYHLYGTNTLPSVWVVTASEVWHFVLAQEELKGRQAKEPGQGHTGRQWHISDQTWIWFWSQRSLLQTLLPLCVRAAAHVCVCAVTLSFGLTSKLDFRAHLVMWPILTRRWSARRRKTAGRAGFDGRIVTPRSRGWEISCRIWHFFPKSLLIADSSLVL